MKAVARNTIMKAKCNKSVTQLWYNTSPVRREIMPSSSRESQYL